VVYTYHTAHLKRNPRDRSGENGPFVLNSPDGAIYREHALARLRADSVCCMLNDTNNWEIVCAKVLTGKVGRLTTNNNNQQQVENIMNFYFCPLDQETGSLIYWASTNEWRDLIRRNLREWQPIPLCGSDSRRHCLCGSERIQVSQAHWIKGCGEFKENIVYWLDGFEVHSGSIQLPEQFSFMRYPSDWIDVSNKIVCSKFPCFTVMKRIMKSR
jgi:hypothetical protein